MSVTRVSDEMGADANELTVLSVDVGGSHVNLLASTDTFAIHTGTGYSAGGTLTHGNIQVHR
jgi:hypothetical protein